MGGVGGVGGCLCFHPMMPGVMPGMVCDVFLIFLPEMFESNFLEYSKTSPSSPSSQWAVRGGLGIFQLF